MASGSGALFDATYYATGCGRPYQRDEVWLSFFGGIAERIVAEIAPASVLDAGCAYGLLVEALRERGVAAEGIDLSDYAISQAHPAIRDALRVGSVAEPFGRRYDLIISIEVLEHMPRAEAEAAVAQFCLHSDDVLFSSSPHDYKEATHFNVNPPAYWAALFARHGLFHDLDFDASFITPWAMRFRRRNDPVQQVVRTYERQLWELRRENHDLRELALEQRHYQGEAQAAQAALAAQQAQAEQLATALAEARSYGARLEHVLALKQGYIAELEGLLRRIEHGRLMRILRTFNQSKKS